MHYTRKKDPDRGFNTYFSMSTLSSPKLVTDSLRQTSRTLWKSSAFSTTRIPWSEGEREGGREGGREGEGGGESMCEREGGTQSRTSLETNLSTSSKVGFDQYWIPTQNIHAESFQLAIHHFLPLSPYPISSAFAFNNASD